MLASAKACSKENSSAPLDELLYAIDTSDSVANSFESIHESQSSATTQDVSGKNDSSFEQTTFRINDFESTYRSLWKSSIIQESGSEGQQNNSTGITNKLEDPGSTYTTRILAKVTEHYINDTLTHSFINVNYKDPIANFSVPVFIKQPGRQGNQNSTIQSLSLRGNDLSPRRHVTVSSESLLNPENKGTQRKSLGNFSEIIKDSGRQARGSALSEDDSTPFRHLQRKGYDGVLSLPSLNAKVIAIHNDLETKILLALTKYEDTIEYDYRSKKEARMHFQAFMSSIANRFEIIYGILSDTDTSVTSNNEYALILYVIYKENAWIADREARNALRKKRETLWKYFAGVADSFRGFASTALMLTESVTSTLAIKSVVVANLDSIGDTMVFHSNSFDDEEWPYESLVSFEVGNDFKEAAKLLDG